MTLITLKFKVHLLNIGFNRMPFIKKIRLAFVFIFEIKQ